MLHTPRVFHIHPHMCYTCYIHVFHIHLHTLRVPTRYVIYLHRCVTRTSTRCVYTHIAYKPHTCMSYIHPQVLHKHSHVLHVHPHTCYMLERKWASFKAHLLHKVRHEVKQREQVAGSVPGTGWPGCVRSPPGSLHLLTHRVTPAMGVGSTWLQAWSTLVHLFPPCYRESRRLIKQRGF